MRESYQESHHSLTRNHQTHSRHTLHSLHQSATNSNLRKMSASSLKNYVDIDRLIDDIKIVPASQSLVNQELKTIMNSLKVLKNIGHIVDEVKTIELLIDSISKKLASNALSNTRTRYNQSNLRQSTFNNNISPVKQIQDNSRIVYTNFSLKEISLPNAQVFQKEQLQTPVKRFDFDRDQNEEMVKLNHEISALEKMLKIKGVGSDFKSEAIGMAKIDHPPTPYTIKPKAYKENMAVPKKYSLLQKTQQISQSKSKGVAGEKVEREKGRTTKCLENNYR